MMTLKFAYQPSVAVVIPTHTPKIPVHFNVGQHLHEPSIHLYYKATGDSFPTMNA
jgi:hypothetical protein